MSLEYILLTVIALMGSFAWINSARPKWLKAVAIRDSTQGNALKMAGIPPM
ncbi:Uncharacterised protein [Serratia fonticola]|uniref:Uncharacterized protein n=1 Tax=Serratia fonticola TaxID=47917 RepID=A0A4U9TUI0_SERFO|nr:Uncharacterised protein [Serratia fonticola]